MRLLLIDHLYYKYPDGIDSLEEFINYINTSKTKFVKMTELPEDHCVAPYFICEDAKTVYLNFAGVSRIEEISGKIMLRIEYERKLKEVVRTKCHDCVHFGGDFDDLDGHCDTLSLAGDCCLYRKNTDD